MAASLGGAELEIGERASYHARHGYRLTSIGRVEYGQGSQGWLVSLKGELARKFWLPFVAYAKNITRLDLQATVWYTEDQAGLMAELREGIRLSGQKSAYDKTTLIDNKAKGCTLYYGSRASSQFGRIYDKWRQQNKSDHYRNAVRFEVEYKKPLAQEIVTWLLRTDASEIDMAARVFGWFSERYISVPLDLTIRDNAIQFPQRETPIDKKLEWLQKTVRPVYRQLVALGYQIEADGSIGVTDNAISVTKLESED